MSTIVSPDLSSVAAEVHAGAVCPRREPVELEIVIPAHNEERRLPRTLDETLLYLSGRDCTASLVVVDNGSQDGTARVARSFDSPRVRVQVVPCAAVGKGNAIRAGFAGSRARFLGFMDADLATPIETLDTVLPLLREGRSAVIGSRRVSGSDLAVGQSSARRLGGNAFRLATRNVLPGIADTQCGFKFFDGKIAQQFASRCRTGGFSFDVELLARMRRAGHDVTEVAVRWSDVEGSTFSPLRHGLRSFTDTWRIRQFLAEDERLLSPAPARGRSWANVLALPVA